MNRNGTNESSLANVVASVTRFFLQALAGMTFFFLASCATSTNVPSQAENSNGSSTASYQKEAESAFQAQQFDRAAQLFVAQAKTRESDQHKTWFNVGASYWNNGNQQDSLKAYEEAVLLYPPYVKAHTRLAKHYFELGDKPTAVKHAKTIKTIQKVEKAASPYWEKAHAIRGRGGDWYKAESLIHQKMAGAYAKLNYPKLAAYERKNAEVSLAKETEERARPGREAKAANEEADSRAFNAELLATIGDATALVLNVDAPTMGNGSTTSSLGSGGGAGLAPISSGGSRNANLAVQGIGGLQQSYQAYADTLNMFEGKLRQQREAAYQQGQEAQAALSNPDQAKIHQEAQGRTDALRLRLERAEKLAKQYLDAEVENAPSALDTLDL